jgi:hypothetical protein
MNAPASGRAAWARGIPGLRGASAATVLVYVLLAAALFAVTPDHRTNPFNGPMVIAGRLLQGEASLPDGIGWMETFTFEGRRYLAYPPMASFLAVPFAALAGDTLGQTVFNSLLIFVNALLVAAVFRAIPRLAPYATLASVAYVLGTPQLYSARYGTVWLLMHTESNGFLLLALWCVLARRAYAWAGLCFCISALTRHAVFAAAPAFALLALLDPARAALGVRVRRIVAFGLGALPPLALVLGYQWLTFGDPLMNTYSATWSQWTQPAPRFGSENVVRNLWFYLTALPSTRPDFPFLRFDAGGQSAWLMSPFLIGVLAPALLVWPIASLFAGAVAMFVFYLFYSWQGYAQFGSRYMQDLYPFLLPVAFSAFARPVPGLRSLLYVLVGAAIAINLFGLYCATQYP